jgi:hypothetical protein
MSFKEDILQKTISVIKSHPSYKEEKEKLDSMSQDMIRRIREVNKKATTNRISDNIYKYEALLDDIINFVRRFKKTKNSTDNISLSTDTLYYGLSTYLDKLYNLIRDTLRKDYNNNLDGLYTYDTKVDVVEKYIPYYINNQPNPSFIKASKAITDDENTKNLAKIKNYDIILENFIKLVTYYDAEKKEISMDDMNKITTILSDDTKDLDTIVNDITKYFDNMILEIKKSKVPVSGTSGGSGNSNEVHITKIRNIVECRKKDIKKDMSKNKPIRLNMTYILIFIAIIIIISVIVIVIFNLLAPKNNKIW